ncbi:MAG: Ribosomal large subunit pseudouridine synthase E [Chroococcopsis gigantea SAG 12.99]|jgi:23S rRNA pseudouridine2457 synthase|nr:pseudouridine synthase [Chlorogloea purpurea SAG 13.99]MDV2998988.1 Ribosomal large subunit pseudouridine synthase E [Chroococcopsis gigantea SAG 12.99]
MAKRYLLFYKPYGVLCQFTDNSPNPRPTLKDYVNVADVYSVGRLDQDSEGLLLLTDDNEVKYFLGDSKFSHPRTYWVQVEGIPEESALKQLREGVDIQDYRTRPAEVLLLDVEPSLPSRKPPIRFRKSIPTSWLEITLTEGRNRQVRRMTAAVGYPTLRLVRYSLGIDRGHKLSIEGLTPGQWREATPDERGALGVLRG